MLATVTHDGACVVFLILVKINFDEVQRVWPKLLDSTSALCVVAVLENFSVS